MTASLNQSQENIEDAAKSAQAALLKFKVSMYDLGDLFADHAATEFLIMTIGTELVMHESVRLLNKLTFADPDLPLQARNVVVNHVLDGATGRRKMRRRSCGGSSHV